MIFKKILNRKVQSIKNSSFVVEQSSETNRLSPSYSISQNSLKALKRKFKPQNFIYLTSMEKLQLSPLPFVFDKINFVAQFYH